MIGPMFGSLGVPELIFIFVLALLVFGPKKLPELGRTLGKAMAEFRKATTELQRTINAELMEQELRDHDPRRVVRDTLRDAKQSLQASLDPPALAPTASSPTATPTPAPDETGVAAVATTAAVAATLGSDSPGATPHQEMVSLVKESPDGAVARGVLPVDPAEDPAQPTVASAT